MTARIQTYTGLRVDPMHLSLQDIRLEDIAHALSNLCRFTGHTSRFYSVAEHSVWTSRLVPPEHSAWVLLHDAAEAYLTDIPSPLKAIPEFAFYREAEERALRTIRTALLRVDPPWSADGRSADETQEDADRLMLFYEAEELMNAKWGRKTSLVHEMLGGTPLGCSPHTAERMFLTRARELWIGD